MTVDYRSGHLNAWTASYNPGMLTAFCMINAEPSQISVVAQKIANLPSVAEVYSITGEFDILAIIKLTDHESLDQAIPEALAKIHGITRTRTVIAFRRFSAQDMAWDVGVN
jgi:DNA-binding Lrp family transcriptional regulator